ncbi:hypothetical protein WQQ_19870 [Hydrocarboniphaga effusa AP103]|uniref:Uncharacterized protein n=1 Tax=Hydrocarboniphaga effusa AP103 TaxID=1172194 RepID=I8TCY9_9GAMM|nr:hypothetical protein WQQ_19870 [Hydrocarboniphaga effusa AP103]
MAGVGLLHRIHREGADRIGKFKTSGHRDEQPHKVQGWRIGSGEAGREAHWPRFSNGQHFANDIGLQLQTTIRLQTTRPATWPALKWNYMISTT